MLSIAEILSQELGQKLQYVQNVIDRMDDSPICATSRIAGMR